MSNRSKSIGRDKRQPRPQPKAKAATMKGSAARTATPQALTYDTINEAVHEYLLKSGLFKTVDSFRQELAYGKSTIDRYVANPQLNFGQAYVLDAFDKGRKEQFFEGWNRLLPMHMQANDEICHKLEFYLHVYFAIYPMHAANPHAGDLNKLRHELNAFKTYLDVEKGKFAQIPELLPFYALLFVPNPHTHASFKHLFNRQWSNDLKNKLNVFLSHFLPPMGPPLIYEIYRMYREMQKKGGVTEAMMQSMAQGESPDAGKMAEEFEGLKRREESTRKTLIESQTKWTNFSRGILAVCTSLFALCNAKSADPARKNVLEAAAAKMQKYERVLTTNERDLHEIEQEYKKALVAESQQPPPVSLLGNLSVIQPKVTASPDDTDTLSPINLKNTQERSMVDTALPELLYAKIREALKESKDPLRICAILQALRWRITRTSHGLPRKSILQAFVDNDLLGCSAPGSNILSALITSPNKKVVEYAVCLINVLASESVGSSYLIKEEGVTPMLIELLVREKGDSNLRQNALGALQKFSLHRKPQTVMIENGMIKWIVNTLKIEAETLSDYTFEYVTALLMNLALRTAGKIKCEDPQLEILKVLNEHIEHENLQVRTYVNGTLYSLLTRPALKEQARALGMPELLKHLLEHSEEQLARQVRYIIDQLESEQVEECVSDDNEDALEYEEDEDYETENEEEVDTDIVNAGLATGEDLLREYFQQPYTPHSVSGASKGGHTRISSSNSVNRNLPSAMKARPKIPRTPINEELLGMIRRENESLLANATHIHRNEDASRKKNKQPQQLPQKDQHTATTKQPDDPPEEEKKQVVVPVPVPIEVKQEEEQPQPKPVVAPAVPVPIPEKMAEMKVETKTEAPKEEKKEEVQEFKLAFETRTKILRTPPGQEKRFKLTDSPYSKYYKDPI